MFKFFRKYNKFILVVGAALLMVAFLIQGTVNMFMGNPADRPVGAIGGESVSFADLNRSAFEVDVLRTMVGGLTRTDSLSWLLMKREAHALGISASSYEAEQALSRFPQERLVRFARDSGVTVEMIGRIVRDWAAVRRYSTLMYGRPRISAPLLERFVYDLQTRVRIAAVAVSTSRYLDRVEPPDEQALQALFDKYKGTPRGEGDPYGFGYRYPDRIKIEYLEIPARLLKEQVKDRVRESDALAHFEANVDQYRRTDPQSNDGQTPARELYKRVRVRILSELRAEAAGKFGRELLKTAHLKLVDRNRKLQKDGSNYYVLDSVEDFQPLPFEELAVQLQKQFGVLPTVRRDDRRWRTPEEVGELDGIGLSRRLDGSESVVEYVRSVRELKPADSNHLVVLRLQKSIASRPLVLEGPDGPSFYLFRITDADPVHSPASLNEVRDQLLLDARRLAAYRLLLAEREKWLQQAREGSFELLRQQLNTDILEPPPFSRREQLTFGPPRPPEVAGIGRDERFAQRVFDLAERVAEQGGVDSVNRAERIDAIGVDREQRLFIVRLDEYTPITRSDYERLAADPLTSAQIGVWLASNTQSDPLSLESLKRRIGFVEAGVDTDTTGSTDP